MSTQATPSNAPALTIDVTQDLESTSDLKNLISANAGALFQLAPELKTSVGQPISSAAGKFAISLKLTAEPKWKAGPVMLSLSPDASCTVTIAAKGEDLEAAMDVFDTGKTTNVQVPAATGMTYVNIDLDFTLAGNVAGTGTLNGLSISGKVAGSRATTLSFCLPVASTTETVTALKTAFSALVFPTSPDALSRMVEGSSCRMTFDGSLCWEIDLKYGLADHKFSAPSCGLLRQCFQTAQGKLALPGADVNLCATATLKYTHTDHFALIVAKPDSAAALLYLVRASTDESSVGAGIKVGITATGATIAVDTAQLQHTVESITGSAALATSVGTTVNSGLNSLETAALAKLNAWIQERNGDAGLSLALSRQTSRTSLFNYRVDLGDPQIVQQSWSGLLSRSIADARHVDGFQLLPGAGVGEQFKQATTLQLHFFNLYKYSAVADFFDHCATELAADGSIRILYDVGEENLVSTNTSSGTVRVHFSGRATAATQGGINQAAVDLNLELSEKGKPKAAAGMTGILAFLKQASLQPAIDAVAAYAKTNAAGTLTLAAVLRSSAYGRLTSSPYLDGKPDPERTRDEANWNAIHAAAVALMGHDTPVAGPWSYAAWSTYNSYCNTGSAGSAPDRRHFGNSSAVPSTFWNGQPPEMAGDFLDATARGMNLFEDLGTLARDVAAVTTSEQWARIHENLSRIVKSDLNMDYAVPVGAAVLSQAAAAGAEPTASTVRAADSGSLTVTLTLA